MTSIGDNSDISEIGPEQNQGDLEGQQSESTESSESIEATESINLEEATLDPAALIEAQQEYGQAEAIESAMTDLVDTAESEDATAPPTEEVGVDRTTSGDADDRPTEEVVAVSEGWSTSGDADDRPTEEMTSEIDGESKDDQHGDEFTDQKPIPAEEAVLDLDGKQGDVAHDPVVKGELEEGVISEADADEGVWPKVEGENVWPKLDSASDLVDFKFFKVEGQAGEQGSLIAKDPAYLEALQPSQSMEAALGRAVIDPAFRQELLDDAQGALSEFELSDEEVALLGQIDPEGLQQVANQIKSQFENLDDPAAQTVLGRIISNVLSSGSGVLKGE
jgi:hypothetical protein